MSVITATSPRSLVAVVRDYGSLFKLRIVLLLDATAVGVMIPAAQGHPRVGAVVAVLAGGTLAAGGAHAINCWFDRDIDAEMTRTRRRPLPAGRIPPWHALVIGILMNVLAFAVLWAGANLLAAALALAGTMIYVFVYTILLKRNTPHNIVIGGAAGAVPPLVGWAAATGHLDATALALFGVIFFWTPPHFWALALVIKRDYAAARIPMLPVVRGDGETARQIVWYSIVLVAVTLLPFAWHTAGVLYLVVALLLGALFLRLAWRLRRETTTARAGVLFKFSLLYLALLFVALAVDPLLG